MIAKAYLYRGQWVADCPRPGCANAEALFKLRGRNAPSRHLPGVQRRNTITCENCLLVSVVDWPDPQFMDAVEAVVSLRPLPDTRNWYPADHANAEAWGIDHGQSIEQMLQENEDHGIVAAG